MECYQTGCFIALLSRLRIKDLNFDDMWFGFIDDSRLICSPIDVEVILKEFSLPFQTYILNNPNHGASNSGLTNLFYRFWKQDVIFALFCTANIL